MPNQIKIEHHFKRKVDILQREGSNIVVKSPLVILSHNDHGGHDATKIDIIKTAASFHGQISRDGQGNVDLVAEMAKHPDALWVRVKAIEADVPNDNGDCFSREEIIKAYKSFEGVPVFTNHENNKVELAKGKVVKADWDDREGSVYCTMYIDRAANGPLCRAVEEGYVTDVSMGTQVDYSVCSICDKKALTADDYCDHVKTLKGRSIDGRKVFEKNYGLKFIEISVVTDGACPDCTIREIIDPNEFLHKVANAVNLYNKSIKTSQMLKDGGQAEIQKLNQAMDLLQDVTQTMLGQRQYIDLEFAAKIMDVLADLQHANDELVDQGYGRIGDQNAGAGMQQMGIPPMPENSGAPTQEQAKEGPKPFLTGPSNMGVGTVTEPATASSSGGKTIVSSQTKLKDLHETITKIYDEAKSRSGGVSVDKEKATQTAAKLAKIWDNPSIKKFQTEVSEGDFTVVIGSEDVWGVRGGQKVASLKIANLEGDIREKLSTDPRGFADEALEAFKAKFAGAASKMEKSAEYTANVNERDQHEMTMEAQLRTQKPNLHPRTNEVRESITEDQLRDKREGYEYHERVEKGRDEITEAQLERGDYHGYDYHKVQNDPRDETMELQLRNTKWKGNVTPADKGGEWVAGVSEQHQQITEGQLNDWKGSDSRHLPTDRITEKQLAEDSENWGRRIASKEDALKAKTAAFKAIANTAIATGATPDEILGVIADFSATPRNSIAAERAVKSLKAYKDSREAMLRRAKFHGAGNVPTSKVADYLLGSLGDEGMTGPVARETLEVIAESKDAPKHIEDAIVTAKSDSKPTKTASSKDFLREVLAGETTETVTILLQNFKSDEKDAEKFANAAFDAAVKIAEKQGYKIAQKIHAIKKGEDVEVFMTTSKGEAPKAEAAKAPEAEVKAEEKTEKTASAAELEARKLARKEVVAQFGGAAPGGEGGGAPGGMPGPGGGTTMPAAPAAGADPTAGVPPVAGLGEAAPGDEEGGLDGEALPPGSICPVCGTDDVEMRHGEFSCNNCGAAGEIEVNVRIKEWPSVIEDTEPKEEEGLGGEGGIGEMGGGAGMEMPGVGMQAAFRLTPEMVKTAGSKPVGSYCPHCGSSEVKLALRKGCGNCQCGNCGGKYEVETLVDTANKSLAGKIRWINREVPKLAKKKMEQLKTAKKAQAALASKNDALKTALNKSGLVMKFANGNVAVKAEIIAELADKGLLAK